MRGRLVGGIDASIESSERVTSIAVPKIGHAGVEALIEESDVVKLREGKIAEVIGFPDKVPQ